MWIFTTKGFLSAVEDRQIHGNMLVRFRDPDHAAAFVARAYAGRSGRRAQIRETPPPADYRWKVSINRQLFSETVAAIAEDIDYDNFKGACHRTHPGPYPGTSLMTVWSAMHAHQTRTLSDRVKRRHAPEPEPELELDVRDLFDYHFPAQPDRQDEPCETPCP